MDGRSGRAERRRNECTNKLLWTYEGIHLTQSLHVFEELQVVYILLCENLEAHYYGVRNKLRRYVSYVSRIQLSHTFAFEVFVKSAAH